MLELMISKRPAEPDEALIVDAAVRGMREIFMPDLNMAKAGVHLLDIQEGGIGQHEQDLDLDQPDIDRSTLMTTLDRLNQRFVTGTV